MMSSFRLNGNSNLTAKKLELVKKDSQEYGIVFDMNANYLKIARTAFNDSSTDLADFNKEFFCLKDE